MRPARSRPTENPYSKLAVDILETIRVQALTLSPSIVAYLKMLVTLGTLRHQLAVEYDLPATVRRFIRGLARQQSLALDPRRTFDRLYAASGRMQRALDFIDFHGAAAAGHPRGRGVAVRVPAQDADRRRGLIRLGLSALVVGAALYVVLAFPGDPAGRCPSGWTTRGSIRAARRAGLPAADPDRNVRGLGHED